jgi:hypothetical protein
MQEMYLFEYAVVRVVPRVEREEFLNVGVVLYCRQKRFLQGLLTLNEARLCSFSPAVDCTELKAYLHAFEQICNGDVNAGPIGKLDQAARFRWLTATRSTVVQTSKIHPGFCVDPFEKLTRLHAQLVL